MNWFRTEGRAASHSQCISRTSLPCLHLRSSESSSQPVLACGSDGKIVISPYFILHLMSVSFTLVLLTCCFMSLCEGGWVPEAEWHTKLWSWRALCVQDPVLYLIVPDPVWDSWWCLSTWTKQKVCFAV